MGWKLGGEEKGTGRNKNELQRQKSEKAGNKNRPLIHLGDSEKFFGGRAMRLTERDLELLRWVNGHGFVTGAAGG